MKSIRNKLEFIKDSFIDFNILCFKEPHLSGIIGTDGLGIENFSSPYRKDASKSSLYVPQMI